MNIAPELVEPAKRLNAFVRQNLNGGCRVFSVGTDCKCALCDLELILDALIPKPQPTRQDGVAKDNT
jgi:hypothetical protein